MAFHPSTAILTAMVLIILIPMLHLSLHLQDLSTWLLRATLSPTDTAFPLDKNPGVHLDNEHELVYHLGDISYFTPTQEPIATFPFIPYGNKPDSHHKNDYNPATVVRVPLDQTVVDAEDLLSSIREYLTYDDVLTIDWLETVILIPDYERAGATSTISFLDWDTIAMLHHEFGTRQVYVDPTFYLPLSVKFRNFPIEVNRLVPPALTPDARGPYLMSRNSDRMDLFPVYRLYSDKYRTFLYGVYRASWLPLAPPGGAKYKALWAVDQWGYNLIPVPSRLYGLTTHPDGVWGERIAVKDIYDINGVVTSAGSRAYGELYGPASSSADSILRLEALGGVFVGKTKTATFAMGSRGNGDTLDEQYPFSARGDGWQTCVGSSSGSACAMGAYDWLDFALGSDTGGSVRGPAAIVGLYGNRPSTGAISLQGVKPLSEYSDTAGVLARDPEKFRAFIKAWYGESPLQLREYARLPKSILVPAKYLEQANPAAQKVVNDFLRSLEDVAGLDIDDFDLDAKLEQRNFTTERLKQLEQRTFDSNCWWTWQKNGKRFQQDYSAKHHGRHAPVDPLTRRAWQQAEKNGSWSNYDESIMMLEEFKHFFNHETVKENNETCSESIMIYNIGTHGTPLYREDELNKDTLGSGDIDGSSVCPWAGCVDYTIPIGQVTYDSAVSHVKEQKAVTVSLIAHPGCDFMLLDFVHKLTELGLIRTVLTGRSAYKVN